MRLGFAVGGLGFAAGSMAGGAAWVVVAGRWVGVGGESAGDGAEISGAGAAQAVVGCVKLAVAAVRVSCAFPIFGHDPIHLGIAVEAISKIWTVAPNCLRPALAVCTESRRNVATPRVGRGASCAGGPAADKICAAVAHGAGAVPQNGTAQDTRPVAIRKNVTAMSNGIDTLSTFGTVDGPSVKATASRWRVW